MERRLFLKHLWPGFFKTKHWSFNRIIYTHLVCLVSLHMANQIQLRIVHLGLQRDSWKTMTRVRQISMIERRRWSQWLIRLLASDCNLESIWKLCRIKNQVKQHNRLVIIWKHTRTKCELCWRIWWTTYLKAKHLNTG